MEANISQKNLIYLKEILEMEKLNHAKVQSYLLQISDPQIRELFETVSKAHEEHYQTLYDYLKSHKQKKMEQ